MRLSKYCNLSQGKYVYNGVQFRLAFIATEAKVVAIPVSDLGEVELEKLSDTSISTLFKIGALTMTTVEEEQSVQVRRLTKEESSKDVRVFIPMLTGACNLGCLYCGQDTRSQFMSKQVFEKLYDRIVEASCDQEIKVLEIRWYGAEPLMAYQDIVRLSDRIRPHLEENQVEFRSMMSTNGTLASFNKIKSMYDRSGLRSIVITLDGWGDSHDKMRPRKSGKGSFRDICKNLETLISNIESLSKLVLTLRINLSQDSASTLDQLLSYLVRIGANHPRVVLTVVPVYDWAKDNSSYRAHGSTESSDPYIVAVSKVLASKLNVRLFPTQTRSRVCSAVSVQEEVIAPDGGLYSCTEYPLVPLYEHSEKLGNIINLDVTEVRPKGRFDNWILSDKASQCRNCSLLPVCGGSCPKRWYDGEISCPPLRLHLDSLFELWAHNKGMEKVE